MSGNGQRTGSSTTVRVSWDVRDDLNEERLLFFTEYRVKATDSELIAMMLADRKAWRAMGEAARPADRKPVQP